MQMDHQQMTNEHLLKALLSLDEEVISFLLKKLNVNLSHLQSRLDAQLEALPGSGAGQGGQYLS